MKNICFYFQVHQPYRVSEFSAFDIGNGKAYFKGPDSAENKVIFEKVAHKCYLPANHLFLKLLKQHSEMKISFSLSGVFLEQCHEYGKIGQKVLNSFKALVDTGQVELLAETYYHSLASLYNPEEFQEQVEKHTELVEELFGFKPNIFRNTELIYSNEIAKQVAEMGFKAMLLEGWDKVLCGRSPNLVYRVPRNILSKKNKFGLLLKNYRLSDDIAFRFSDKNWEEHPLSVEKFIDWLHGNYGEHLNLFMDYETFGEHQWEESGIFKFLEALPKVCEKNGIGFMTPSEVLANNKHEEELDIQEPISWADMERDLSAWLGNSMQEASLRRLYDLRDSVLETEDEKLIHTWRKLQTSDHFYYMCTKYWNDGDVHKYFSPFESPYEAFMHYNNILRDFEDRLNHISL